MYIIAKVMELELEPVQLGLVNHEIILIFTQQPFFLKSSIPQTLKSLFIDCE